MTYDALISSLKQYDECLWINPHKKNAKEALALIQKNHPEVPDFKAIQEADERLKRFAPVFMKLFPETEAQEGLIESDIKNVEAFQKGIITFVGGRIIGDWFVKLDSHLDIAGSVKARGGVYEVIQFAESLAIKEGLINLGDDDLHVDDSGVDYLKLLSDEARSLFAQYTIAVGSTGNLGLSIGIMGKALGFQVEVHMSKDAKPWKVQMLRDKGAQVILHDADYSVAVEQGRIKASENPKIYFIDDENSITLFTGYAVAALRLKAQFDLSQQVIDKEHPLFVYLPCGVGGAPGGIAYGLKLIFGDAVHLFFAEPTHAPCMLLGMASGKHDGISVADIDIDGITEADGLAVGRASGFVGKVMEPLLDGVYTVSDDKLYWMLYMLSISSMIKLEPSALAGFAGPINLMYTTEGFNYLRENNLLEKMENAKHLSWATGGGLVPTDIMDGFIERGKSVKVEF